MPNVNGVTMRSALGRVRGLGSARSGLTDWWIQRVTAAALVPLSVWFVVSLLVHLGEAAPDMTVWAVKPWNTVLLLAFFAALFRHVGLGLKVIIEDYVHVVAAKVAGLLVMNAIVALLWIAATVSVLKLAFTG